VALDHDNGDVSWKLTSSQKFAALLKILVVRSSAEGEEASRTSAEGHSMLNSSPSDSLL